MTSQHYLSQIKEPVRLPLAALAFARAIAYPDLDSQPYIERIEDLARQAEQQLPAGYSPLEKAAALARFMFGPGGFRGNTAQYYDPRNSFLNDVLDRKLGIPITLTVLLIEVGSILDLHIQGVGLPGHFIAMATAGGESIFLDPFHGGQTLTAPDCQSLVRQMGGPDIPFNPDWLQPVSHFDILVRMLNNLRTVYLQKKDWGKTLQVLELLQLTQPNEPAHTRDIGLIHFKQGNRRCAIYNLESYILRKFQAPDLPSIRALLTDLVQGEARAN